MIVQSVQSVDSGEWTVMITLLIALLIDFCACLVIITIHYTLSTVHYFQMRHVWPDVHQMGDARTALAFGIALEELTDLEEEHDEDGLGELRLSPGQETDAEGTDGSDRHEEMLVEGITMGDSLPRFVQGLVTN